MEAPPPNLSFSSSSSSLASLPRVSIERGAYLSLILHQGLTSPSAPPPILVISIINVRFPTDYPAGNVHSVRNAIRHLGFKIKDVQTLADILNAKHLIFPGVGAFASAVDVLNKTGMAKALCTYIEKDRSFLGICLGLQLLFEPSEENGPDVGLSVLKRFLFPKSPLTKKPTEGKASKLAKRVRNLGKPVELAGQYYIDGADEVSFLNITGFRDFPLGDLPMLQKMFFVPLNVERGIRDFTDAHGRYYSSLEVAAEYFRSRADEISIGSDAVFTAEEYSKTKVKTGKSSIEQISWVYGNQAVVVSIDPRRIYLNSPEDVEFKAIKSSNPGKEKSLLGTCCSC